MDNRPIIFVLDDDITVLKTIKKILMDDNGYDVHVFDNAVDLLADDLLSKVNLLIIDVSLKDKDGRLVYNDVCSTGMEIPALFISSIVDDSAFNNLSCAYIYDFMPKPFQSNRIFVNRVKLLLKVSSKLYEKDRKLEAEEQKLASIVRYSSELINLANLDGQMVFINKAGSEILGIEPEEAGMVNILDIIPETQHELISRELLPALLQNSTWEGDLQYRNIKTGKITDVHAMAFTITDINTGEPLYLANVSLDITKRRKAELEKERLNNLFEAVLDQVPFGIDVIEKNGHWRVVKSSAKSKEITGEFNLESVSDASLDKCNFNVFDSDGNAVPMERLPGVRSFLHDEYVDNEELFIVREDGTEVYVSFKSVPVKDKAGKTVAGLQISFDITEYKLMENSLKNQQSLLRSEIEKRLDIWKRDISNSGARTQFRIKELSGAIDKKIKESIGA